MAQMASSHLRRTADNKADGTPKMGDGASGEQIADLGRKVCAVLDDPTEGGRMGTRAAERARE